MAPRLSRDAKQEASHEFFNSGLHIPTRTLYMGSVPDADGEEGGTDFRMADRVIKGLHILDIDSDEGINIIMNNPGGDEYHGLAIFDAIKNCRSHVVITVFGMGMSMGSVILQAGDERILAPNSRIMIHYGTWEPYGQHSKAVYKWCDEGKKFDAWMRTMYLEKMREKIPDMTEKKLDGMLDFDTILTAQEAIDLGLADKILGEK